MDNEINHSLMGADQLRDMLNHSISLGANSIASQAYQVKIRVKSSNSIKEKVLERRGNGKKEYRTQDITDIVGFRFLTLFQQDLLSFIENFVNYLEDFQPRPTDLFYGASLHDCVKEVIVYHSNTNEEIYDSIYGFLRGYFVKRGFDSNFVNIDKKDSRYSSVHFIVLGQVHLDSEIKVIPIEFQVRTVFEDVWGEIQHMLMYKNPWLARADNAAFRRQQGGQILSILKNNIDSCSEQAKLAYFTLRSEGPDASLRQAAKSAQANTVSVLKGVEQILGARGEGDVESLRMRIFDTYQLLHKSDLTNGSAEMASAFRSLVDEIVILDNKWSGYVPIGSGDEENYRYAVDMEKAAANYWIGQSLANFAPEDLPSDFEASVEYFEKARLLYFGLTSYETLSDDPVLNYRIGQIYRKLGQSRLSIIYYRAAFDRIRSDGWKDRGSIFEILIPRHLAYMIWQSAESTVATHLGLDRLYEMSAEERRKNPLVLDYLSRLKESYEITRSVNTDNIDQEEIDVASIEEEKMLAYNNALWYGVDYVDLGGEFDAEIDFNQEFYNRFKEHPNLQDIAQLPVNVLDTLLRASCVFADSDNGLTWLEELRKRKTAGDLDGLENWQKMRIIQTIERAQEILNSDST